MILKLLYLSNLLSDFDQVCGRLHDLIRACIYDSIAINVAVSFKIKTIIRGRNII